MQEAKHPALEQLGALAGEWEIRASVQGRTVADGRTTFGWLEGGAFLVQHADARATELAPAGWVANSPFPVTTIIGLDDSTEAFSMLYADARGVFRVYQMSLSDRVWKLWRAAPGFHQRFTGVLSEDGTVIDGRWEASDDGTSWETDFDLTYTKIR